MRSLVEATTKILNAAKPKDGQLSQELDAQFLYMMIEAMLTRTFNRPIGYKATKKQKFEFVRDNFEAVKREVQEAIALAFQEALEKYSGLPIEYICTIKAVPKESSSKTH